MGPYAAKSPSRRSRPIFHIELGARGGERGDPKNSVLLIKEEGEPQGTPELARRVSLSATLKRIFLKRRGEENAP